MNRPNKETGRSNGRHDAQPAPHWPAWLALNAMPAAAEWKALLRTAAGDAQRLSDRLQEEQQQCWSAWHQRMDSAGLVSYYRQSAQTSHQITTRLLDWQMQAVAQWQQLGFTLLPRLLGARSDGDRILAFAAAQQDARKKADGQTEALQVWLSSISPAFLQGLQQWLEADESESAASAGGVPKDVG
jgi:hypothetical protein